MTYPHFQFTLPPYLAFFIHLLFPTRFRQPAQTRQHFSHIPIFNLYLTCTTAPPPSQRSIYCILDFRLHRPCLFPIHIPFLRLVYSIRTQHALPLVITTHPLTPPPPEHPTAYIWYPLGPTITVILYVSCSKCLSFYWELNQLDRHGCTSLGYL